MLRLAPTRARRCNAGKNPESCPYGQCPGPTDSLSSAENNIQAGGLSLTGCGGTHETNEPATDRRTCRHGVCTSSNPGSSNSGSCVTVAQLGSGAQIGH